MRKYVGRQGEVNAWDNENFVKAVRATGKKTLIMAGVWTSVCVMFPALDAKAAGYKVYAVMDASGDPSEMASQTAMPLLASSRPALSQHRRTRCCRNSIAPGIAPGRRNLLKLYALAAPNYAAVIESYQKAQEVARQTK